MALSSIGTLKIEDGQKREEHSMPIHESWLRREHQAWLAIGQQLKQAGIDLNANDALNAALVLWGENLVALRSRQGLNNDEQLVNAEDNYNRQIGFLPYHETEQISQGDGLDSLRKMLP